jgi:hypothetical protein
MRACVGLLRPHAHIVRDHRALHSHAAVHSRVSHCSGSVQLLANVRPSTLSSRDSRTPPTPHHRCTAARLEPRLSRSARYPARHGIPHGTVSRTARYPARHGIPHGTVSRTARYPARHGVPHRAAAQQNWPASKRAGQSQLVGLRRRSRPRLRPSSRCGTGPVGSLGRAFRRTACNMQEATCDIKHATCSMRHTTYNMQHAAYDTQHTKAQSNGESPLPLRSFSVAPSGAGRSVRGSAASVSRGGRPDRHPQPHCSASCLSRSLARVGRRSSARACGCTTRRLAGRSGSKIG